MATTPAIDPSHFEASDLVAVAVYFARRKAPRHLVEDAAGAFLVGALRALRRADPSRDPQGYSVVAGLNALRDLLRSEGRQRPSGTASLDAPLGEGDGTLAETVPDAHTPAPDAALLAEDVAGTVRRAVAALPERERQAVTALYFTGQTETVRTAGARLGVSRQSVATWHHQALASLRADPSVMEIA